MARRPIPLVSLTGWSTLPLVATELLKRRGHVAAQRPELSPVVLVRDRTRAVFEFELLQSRERAIPLLEQSEPTPLCVVQIVELVRLGLGLANERKRDHDDTRDRKCRGEHECQRQRVAGMPTSDARATRRRCSRRSGQSVISEPIRKTSPASQIRLTSGLTNTRK